MVSFYVFLFPRNRTNEKMSMKGTTRLTVPVECIYQPRLSRDNLIVVFDRYNVIKDSGGKQI